MLNLPHLYPYFIAVVGHLGLEKALFVQTLGYYLAQFMDVNIHIENATHENPFLKDFYLEPKRWSFHSQTHIMVRLAQDFQQTLYDRTASVFLSDHLPGYEDIMVYSQLHHDLGYLNDREWETLQEAFKLVKMALPHPDIVIHLKATDLKDLHRKLNSRGRTGDTEVTLPYLHGLDRRFSAMVGNITQTYNIVVPLSTTEAIHNQDLIEAVGDHILSVYRGSNSTPSH